MERSTATVALVYLILWKEKLVWCSLQRKLLHLEYGIGSYSESTRLLAMGGYREAMAAVAFLSAAVEG